MGFRPFVWQLAQRFGLSGQVANDAEGVLILCDAAPEAFLAALRAEAPVLSRIDAVEVTPAPRPEGAGFRIAASGQVGAETRVTPMPRPARPVPRKSGTPAAGRAMLSPIAPIAARASPF
ncbi:acylphosphatase [Gemmobacter lanyuensis]